MDYEDLQEENLNFDERLTNLEHQFSKLSRSLDFFLTQGPFDKFLLRVHRYQIQKPLQIPEVF